MNALIQITTNEQGSEVVSARELHEFLEVKTKFADWIKGRIIKWGFRQDADYVEVEGFSEISEKGGRPTLDYALTLDMAKELSMVENNEKGKIARRYFIEAEKALHKIAAAPALSTEQVLIQLVSQQTKIMADTQLMLAQLRADVDEIKAGQKPTLRRAALPHQLNSPTKKTPSSLRQTVSRRVNDYCAFYGAEQSEAYNYLYKRMYELYKINVHQMHRKPGEYIIDAVERYGHLERLYGLVASELIFIEQ